VALWHLGRYYARFSFGRHAQQREKALDEAGSTL